MALIGVLGGMSWQSTAEYYRLFNDLTQARLGGLHSAPLLIRSVDFATIEHWQTTGDWDAAGAALADAARGLARAGADCVLIATNTMHKVAPAVEEALSVPLLHLGDATANAVRAADVQVVGLLGTRFTMSQAFYRERLEAHGLRVLVPSDDDQALVHRVIYDELCHGILRDESRTAYVGVIRRLVDAGAEGIVLGCTEIELLVDANDVAPLGVPAFPTTRLHVEAALDWADIGSAAEVAP